MKTLYLCTFISSFIFCACNKEPHNSSQSIATNTVSNELLTGINTLVKTDFILPESSNFAAIPQDPNNPLTKEKIHLGQLLLHETRLGGNPKNVQNISTYSCASCHHSEAGFQSGLAQGIGEGGSGFGITGEGRVPFASFTDSADVQSIRTPTLLNIAYEEVSLWGGQMGAKGVNAGTENAWKGKFTINNLGYFGPEIQAIGGVTIHRLKVDTAWLLSKPMYKNLFDKAFPGLPAEQRISATTIGLAIAAYERVLLPNQAPFQRWLRGDTTALSADEKTGAGLFFGKAGCVKCHTGPSLSSSAFYALGMNDMQNENGAINVNTGAVENKGRGGFTGLDSDMYKFKVPQLYNLKDARFLGHGASFTSVDQVIRYINAGVQQNSNVPASQLAKEFVPLNLSEDEITKLVKFVEVGLYDPNLIRFTPAAVPSGNCIPNNDIQSKIDRGCPL